MEFLQSVLTFRSARKGIVRNEWEAWHEALTQYLISGLKVRKKAPDVVQGYGEKGRASEMWEDYYRNEFKDGLEGLFDDALDDAKGKFFVV